jgi:hypothetical protein
LTETRVSVHDDWQVADRRYLSEGSCPARWLLGVMVALRAGRVVPGGLAVTAALDVDVTGVF